MWKLSEQLRLLRGVSDSFCAVEEAYRAGSVTSMWFRSLSIGSSRFRVVSDTFSVVAVAYVWF